MSAMANLAIRLAEIRSEVTGKDFDTCLDELIAERDSAAKFAAPEPQGARTDLQPSANFARSAEPRLIGPNTDALADVPTVQFLHSRLGQEHPISGDMIARYKTAGNQPGNKKTADELQLAAVETNTL